MPNTALAKSIEPLGAGLVLLQWNADVSNEISWVNGLRKAGIRLETGSRKCALLAFVLLTAMCFAAFACPAVGADIRFSEREEQFRVGDADIIVEGKIEVGDYDKLLKLIKRKANDIPATSFSHRLVATWWKRLGLGGSFVSYD